MLRKLAPLALCALFAAPALAQDNGMDSLRTRLPQDAAELLQKRTEAEARVAEMRRLCTALDDTLVDIFKNAGVVYGPRTHYFGPVNSAAMIDGRDDGSCHIIRGQTDIMRLTRAADFGPDRAADISRRIIGMLPDATLRQLAP